MSITGPGSITAANVQAVTNMNNQLNTLSEELSTGQAAQTYSGLGSQAGVTLSLNAQLSAINGYSNTATTVGTTLSVAQSVLTQLDGSGSTVVQTINQQGAFSLNNNGQTTTQTAAQTQLQQILSLLNTQVGDNYIFSGSALNQPSVASTDAILNGNGAQAGFTQVISERQQADLGAQSGEREEQRQQHQGADILDGRYQFSFERPLLRHDDTSEESAEKSVDSNRFGEQARCQQYHEDDGQFRGRYSRRAHGRCGQPSLESRPHREDSQAGIYEREAQHADSARR